MALHIFRSARAALEATRGTDLTPTRLIYQDEIEHQQEVATIRPQQLRNSYVGWYSAAAGTETNTLRRSGALSYNDAVWDMNTHVKAVASGTGAGADKTWTFLPTHTSDDIKSATMQLGYSDGLSATQPGVRLNYCLGDEYRIKWDKKDDDGSVSFASQMVSPKAAAQISAFTGSLSDRTVTLISATGTVVTVDTTTIGTTPDNFWTDVEWTLNNGYRNLYTLNNTTAAQDTFRPNARAWKLAGSRYYAGAVADTEWDAFVAKTPRKVRIKTTGPVLGGSFYSIQLDLYGVYTAMEWGERDGLGMHKFTLEPIYDTTALTDFQVIVVTAEAAIT